MQQALTQDTGRDAMVKGGVRRSVRLKDVKRSDGMVHDSDNVDTLRTAVSTKEYQSAIARHLSLNSECAKAYCDDCLVLYRVLGLFVILKFLSRCIFMHNVQTSVFRKRM